MATEDDMSMFYVLTSAEADIVRDSIYSVVPRYVPIRRAGDMYIVPASIRSQPVHAQWFEFFDDIAAEDPSRLMDHTSESFPGPYEEPE